MTAGGGVSKCLRLLVCAVSKCVLLCGSVSYMMCPSACGAACSPRGHGRCYPSSMEELGGGLSMFLFVFACLCESVRRSNACRLFLLALQGHRHSSVVPQ